MGDMMNMMNMMQQMHGGMMGGGMMGGMGPMGGTMMQMFDADGDGTVTAEEMRAGMLAQLAEYDSDSDGALSIAEFEALFGSDQHWLTKLEDYLLKPRDGLKGCRIGRIAQDPSLEDVLLRLPMKRYFNHLQLRLTALFNEAKELGELPESCNAENLAATVISTLQGGFVLSRGVHDPTLVTDACRGLLELLSAINNR